MAQFPALENMIAKTIVQTSFLRSLVTPVSNWYMNAATHRRYGTFSQPSGASLCAERPGRADGVARKVYYAWYTARGGLETLLSISSLTVALARLSFVHFGKAKYWRFIRFAVSCSLPHLRFAHWARLG